MKIEIWSDVVCPWCYIGKRRLETALAGFEHADDVEVVWRSYQLDPGAPTTPTETMAQVLGRKYGGGESGGLAMMDRVEAVAAEEGLLYRLKDTQRVNTVDAHRVLHLALETGGPALQGAVKERLLSAYFIEGRNIADHPTLIELASAAGLSAETTVELLSTNRFRDEVFADAEQAAAYGANGVPFFVIDQKYGVSGAQPDEAFTQVLQQAWTAAHPQLEMLSDTADACGPDGCAI